LESLKETDFYETVFFTEIAKLTIGLMHSEIIIPIVPACGEGIPLKYRIRQVLNPKIDDENAPNFVIRLLNNPQTNGPRKAAPIEPQEIPRIATIVDGFK
jgi:hypothetical protein